MRVFTRRRPPGSPGRRTPGFVRRVRASGFTLVELAVTLVVLAVLVGIATPLFTGLMNSNRLTSNANELVAALQIARMESIRRNVRTTICQSADQLTCTDSSPWRGWIIFADLDGDGVVDANEVLRTGRIVAPMQVIPSQSITLNRIVFRADGMPYSSGNILLEGNLRVCLPVTNPQRNARDVNIAIGGRAAVRAPANLSGACPAPPNT